ncbi:MAG: ABC transporter permease, partial [Candidatus Promineifilaceae bacterium]|nr:ABC transporter permease [Candidatus Promineifilaceae bacterium]
MPFTENISLALRGLSANKLRAALTMLGIMIGVAAVITLLAIGDGVNRYIADQFVGLGTNLIFVSPGDDPGLVESTLTISDAEILADPAVVPDAQAVAPVYFRGIELRYQGRVHESQMQASTPDYGLIRDYEVARGRFIDDNDYSGRSRVAVLGPEAVTELFPDDVDPLEATIKINGIPFRVVGLLESKGGGTFGSRDDLVVLPLTTAQERLINARSQRTGAFLVDTILVQAVSSDTVNDVVIDVTNALRQAHNITFR